MDRPTPALYRSKFIHIALFGWVTNARNNGAKIRDSILDFQNYMGLHNVPYSTLYMAYFRMTTKFMECKKHDRHFNEIDIDCIFEPNDGQR